MLGLHKHTKHSFPDDHAAEFVKVFQKLSSCNSVFPCDLWKEFEVHPFAPRYISLHITPYCQLVENLQSLCTTPSNLDSVYTFTLKRLLYEKNKKKVFVSTVEHLLPNLLRNHSTSEVAQNIVITVLLNKDNISLLEANLVASMKNYTFSLVKKLTELNVDLVVEFLELFKDRIHSKNRNKLVLTLYLQINNNEFDRNAAILQFIVKHRFYNAQEDNNNGNKVQQHLENLLSTLSGPNYCVVATAILQLNYEIVPVPDCLRHLNTTLLTQLFRSYNKVGRFVNLWEILLKEQPDNVVFDDVVLETLSDITQNLTEATVVKLVKLLSTQLENLAVQKPNVEFSTKKQKINTNFTCVISRSLSVILFNQTYYQNEEMGAAVVKAIQSCDGIPKEAAKYLEEWASRAIQHKVLPTELEDQVAKKITSLIIKHSEDTLQTLNAIKDSRDPVGDVDKLLSSEDKNFPILLANLHLIYEHLITDHFLILARLTLSNLSKYKEIILTNYTFKTMIRFQSVLLSCLLELATSEPKLSDPDSDLTLAASRDIIFDYAHLKRSISETVSNFDLEFVFKLATQLPLSECYHHKLCVITSLLCMVEPEHANQLRRFCKPRDRLLSLPILHGRSAGAFLSRVFIKSTGSLSESSYQILKSYLLEAVVLSSVKLEPFFDLLFADPGVHLSLVDVILSEVISVKPKCVERYRELLYDLSITLAKVIDNTSLSDDKINLMRLHHVTCSVLSAELTWIYFDIVCESLISDFISLPCKLRIVEVYLLALNDDSMVNRLANSLIPVEMISLNGIRFSTRNKAFISNLLKTLPSTTTKALLSCIQPEPDDCEDLSDVHNIPLGILPKLIPKLTKKQVITSLHSTDNPDVEILSECMLELAHAAFPPHVFTLIFDKMFQELSSADYSSSAEVLSNVSRTCELLVKNKTAMRHHCPYILMSILEHISTGKSPQLVKDTTPIVNILLEACTSHGVQFLQTRLSSGAKQLFLQLHKFYNENIKYEGKI